MSACGVAPEDGVSDVVRPATGEGKEDVNLAAISERGYVLLGEEVAGEFTADFQFLGYRFGGAEGAEVAIEITQAGTARDLDTTLFVYGPEVTNASDEIAFDDDSGWGSQSAIESLLLPAQGSYLVVVGTADGRGRGHFNLALSCLSEDCRAAPAPLSCEDFQDYVDECGFECVNDYLAHTDWGPDDCPEGRCPVEQDIIDECFVDCTTDEYFVADYREFFCEDLGDWQRQPEWCGEPMEDFMAVWDPCKSELEALDAGDFEW